MTKEERRALRVQALERQYADQPTLLAKKLADLRKTWWEADQPALKKEG